MPKHGKTRLMAFLLAVFLLLTSHAWAAPKHSVDDWLEIIEYYYAREQYDEMFKQFDKAVQEYPNDVGLLYFRGLRHMQAGDRATALADFQRVLKLDSNDIDGYIGLALIAACDGNMHDSWDYFERAAGISTEYAPLYVWRARMYYGGISDYQGALRDYETARAYVTSDQKAELLDQLMLTYNEYAAYYPEYFPEVVNVASELLAVEDLAPNYALEAYATRMDAYSKMHRYSEALLDSQKITALMDEYELDKSNILLTQGVLLYKMQQPAEAKQRTLEALKLNPSLIYPRYYEDDPDFAKYPIKITEEG